jgi:hypothetical protein
MALVDEDIELIEASLDGSLSDDEAADLRDRLGRDPELTAAMVDLRSQRESRRDVWSGLEPTDADVERLVQRVSAAIRDQRVFRFARPLRIASALAACIAISFVAGWKLHTQRLASTSNGHSMPANAREALTYDVALTDEQGRVTAVQNFDSLEKAREFARDLGEWQHRQQQMRDGAAVIVADRF